MVEKENNVSEVLGVMVKKQTRMYQVTLVAKRLRSTSRWSPVGRRMQSKCIKIANSTFIQPDQGRWKQPNLFGGTKFPVVITRQSQHDCPLGGSNTDAVSSVLILKHSQDRPKFSYFSLGLQFCLPYYISLTSRRPIFRNIFEALYFVLQVSPAGRGGLGSNKRVAKPKYQ